MPVRSQRTSQTVSTAYNFKDKPDELKAYLKEWQDSTLSYYHGPYYDKLNHRHHKKKRVSVSLDRNWKSVP